MPNSSSTTTTSPRAINVPFTRTSTGAPAGRSRSITAPGVIDSSSRMVIAAPAELGGHAHLHVGEDVRRRRADVATRPGRGRRCGDGHGATSTRELEVRARAHAQGEAREYVAAVEQREHGCVVVALIICAVGCVDLVSRFCVDLDDRLLGDRADRGVEPGDAGSRDDVVVGAAFERFRERGDRVQRDHAPVAVGGREAQGHRTRRLVADDIADARTRGADCEDPIVTEPLLERGREGERSFRRRQDLVEMTHWGPRRFMGSRSARPTRS